MPPIDSLNCRRTLEVDGKSYDYFSLPDAAKRLGDIDKLADALAEIL